MDFKEVSMNALAYAIKKHPRASITALHVVSDVIDKDYVLHHTTQISHEDVPRYKLESEIKDYLKIDQLPERITVDLTHGEPVNMISRYLNKKSFDVVFIGARDNYSILDKLLGTVSFGVVKKARVPVFVIPRHTKYQDYKKILVASDEHIGDPDIILQLNYWNSHNAQMKFLHIVEDEKSDGFEKEKKAILTQFYEDYQPSFSYEIESIKAKNTADSLLAAAYHYNANLLITIARNASFVHSLLYKSLSKELLMKAAIPMLFLHTPKKY